MAKFTTMTAEGCCRLRPFKVPTRASLVPSGDIAPPPETKVRGGNGVFSTWPDRMSPI